MRKDNRSVQKLRCEVEEAKLVLSATQSARIEIESFYDRRPLCHLLNHKNQYFLQLYVRQDTIALGEFSVVNQSHGMLQQILLKWQN